MRPAPLCRIELSVFTSFPDFFHAESPAAPASAAAPVPNEQIEQRLSSSAWEPHAPPAEWMARLEASEEGPAGEQRDSMLQALRQGLLPPLLWPDAPTGDVFIILATHGLFRRRDARGISELRRNMIVTIDGIDFRLVAPLLAHATSAAAASAFMREVRAMWVDAKILMQL